MKLDYKLKFLKKFNITPTIFQLTFDVLIKANAQYAYILNSCKKPIFVCVR